MRRITHKDKRLIIADFSRKAVFWGDRESAGILVTYGSTLRSDLRERLREYGWSRKGALVVDSGGYMFITGTFRSVPNIREYHELAKSVDPDIVFTFDPHDFGADPAVVMSRFLKHYKEQADYWAADGAPYLLYAVVHAKEAYSVSHELQMLREFAKYVESVHGRELDGVGITLASKSIPVRYLLLRKVIELMPHALIHILICASMDKMLLMKVINAQSGDTALFSALGRYIALRDTDSFRYDFIAECYNDESIPVVFRDLGLCSAIKEFEWAVRLDWGEAVDRLIAYVESRYGQTAVEELRQLVRTVQAVGRV